MASHLPHLFPVILFLLAFFFLHSAAAHNYKDALSKSIPFFEGQRSGKLPPNQRMSSRGDSALSDGSNAHVDLVGGYYEGGDNVKSTFPMAFTTTMLSWSVLEFGGLMKGELQNAKMAIRWATDYLLKATAHPNTIYVQVGEADSDHVCWERPEDMDTTRNVYQIDQNTPGTDVAAETAAAALAAASLVFKKTDVAYSDLLLDRAKSAFEFADEHRGSYVKNLLDVLVCPLLCTSSGMSCCGELRGCTRVQGLEDMKKQADKYICSLIPGSSSSSPSHYTPALHPGGLLFKMEDNIMQYVTSASFLLLTYANCLQSVYAAVKCGGATYFPRTLRAIAKKQVDYILGSNPLKMSFMVGYGPKFPRRIHHRGSSISSIRAHPEKIECSEGISYYLSQNPNPNTLVGAVVGGPGRFDRFPDPRGDSDRSGPATYTNAPLVELWVCLPTWLTPPANTEN